MIKTVIGLFASLSGAQSVVNSLENQGIPRDDIRLVPEVLSEPDSTIASSNPTTCGVAHSSERPDSETEAPASVAVDLIEIGMPEKKAVYYSEAVRRGGTLVCVTVDESKVETARNIIDCHGSLDINNQAAEWRRSGWDGLPGDSEHRLVVETTYVLGA